MRAFSPSFNAFHHFHFYFFVLLFINAPAFSAAIRFFFFFFFVGDGFVLLRRLRRLPREARVVCGGAVITSNATT